MSWIALGVAYCLIAFIFFCVVLYISYSDDGYSGDNATNVFMCFMWIITIPLIGILAIHDFFKEKDILPTLDKVPPFSWVIAAGLRKHRWNNLTPEQQKEILFKKKFHNFIE